MLKGKTYYAYLLYILYLLAISIIPHNLFFVKYLQTTKCQLFQTRNLH